jgi:NAD(P)-dependent dehydrogenase (short-subunit alcohol dehydrogenase family)
LACVPAAPAGQLPPRFADAVCVVTGGGSGIGRAASERFAREGGRVAIVDRNPAHGRETTAAIAAAGGEAMFTCTDVGVPAQVRAAIDEVVARWHRIDVLVNDAATMTFQPILDLPDDDWDRVLDVNLRSIFLFCKYGVPHMRAGGAIVNISSVHAHETTRHVVPYAASKGGMEAFTRGFSEEMAPRGVRVNCIAPGAVNTPMLWNNPNIKSGVERVTGAVGEPADIAAAICFLASSEARFITGTTLVVDGGRLDLL